MKQYTVDIIDVLLKLGIPVPDEIRMDQRQITRLVGGIKGALETYDPTPPATGDATVDDVVAGKTFSNADESGLVGILTLAGLTSDATATAEDITDTKTAYVNGELLVGTKKHDNQLIFEQYTVGQPFSAAASAEMLELNSNVMLVMAHGEDAYKFVPLRANAEQTELYLAGISMMTPGVLTSVMMTMTYTEGIANITAVTDSTDADVTEAWLTEVGTLRMYVA